MDTDHIAQAQFRQRGAKLPIDTVAGIGQHHARWHFRCHGTSNLLVLHTDLMGDVGVFTLKPGLDQTAYGLFSDLVEIARTI